MATDIRLQKYYQKQMDALADDLTFRQREQLVLNLLVDGISIADIATIVHCSPDATQLIADVAIENYKPAWAN
jgi:DNA-binding NarL/FixJ family response regulator